ncbi:MAG: TraB/GumN family protein [Methanomassiliicoccales archaeon]|jgi:pheromone shutdown protein TraB
MITLIGVGHVFDIKRQVRDVIMGQMPSAVGVELDPGRYEALIHPQQPRAMPITYRIMAKFQRRLAKELGGELGGEMLSAVETAKELGIPFLFIDADASVMFNKLMETMPIKERLLLALSAFAGFFASKKQVETELENFTANEEAYMKQFERQFPTLKKALIDDRNRLMADNISMAEDTFGSVVAVIGDGHVDGIMHLLQGRQVQLVRLKQLLDSSYPKGFVSTGKGGAEISYQYTVADPEGNH